MRIVFKTEVSIKAHPQADRLKSRYKIVMRIVYKTEVSLKLIRRPTG
jgi:hypothetical protein